MSLKAAVIAAAKSAMTAIDDLATTITYTSVNPNKTYNPITDTTTGADTEVTSVPCALTQFKSDELDASILVITDRKLIIVSTDLSVSPKTNDFILTSGGDKYEVVRDISPPENVVYILHIRRVGS